MSDEIEIILRAIDNVSDIFSSITSSAESMGSSIEQTATEASTGLGEIDSSATDAGGSIQDIIDYCQDVDGSGFDEASNAADELGSAADEAASGTDNVNSALGSINGAGFDDAAASADDLEREVSEADQEVQNLSNDLAIINSGMLLQTADQVKGIGSSGESMAQGVNTAAISVGQLSTVAGVAEPQMIKLVQSIANVTFPKEEAMLYIKNLVQIGVETENLGSSATSLDKIHDAFGLSAERTAQFAQELSVLGVDMNHLETSYNALAYANANTVGGMDNFFRFLQKYDAQFKELGLDVDQSAVLISAATKKFGGGKAAFSGLGEAIKGSNGDLRELEKSLDLAPGSLDNASAATAEYEGQLEQLAGEEMEHKTALDHLSAAWDQLSLSLSPVLAPLGSAIGLIGQLGGFGLQLNGLKQLGSMFMSLVSSVSAYAAGLFGLTAAEEAEAAAAATGTAVKEGEVVANEAVGASATAAAAGESLMLWPLLLIIAAIVALVAIVYEVGKAFGWWDDIPGMLAAIWDGLNRMWNAFINHPDVQAAIAAITSALQWLWGEIQKAGQAVMEFFGITNDGSFDIVRALIDTVGAAWNMMRTNIMNVVTVCMMLWNATEPLRNVLIEIGGYLLGEFMAALNTVAQIFGVIWNGVSQLVNIFQQFQDGQISLPGLLIGIWSTLNTMFAQVLSLIIQNAARWASQLISWAVQAGSGFVSNIISFISQLPWRVLAFLTTVLVYVVQKTTQWVNTARSKASQLVSQVVSFLSQLPGRALSALLGVVSAIVSAGSQWVSNARSKASQVVSGVVGALSGLPGRVASAVSGVVSAIVSPFQTAYSRVMSWVNKIKSAASSVLHLAAGGEDFLAAGGEDLLTGETFDITSGKSIDVDGSIDINLNVDGLPEGVSDDQVSQIFEEMINDPDFKDELIRQIVGSKLFQRLDAKEKNRLLRINNRAKGV